MKLEEHVQKNVGKVMAGFGDFNEKYQERHIKRALLHDGNEILTNIFLQEINMKLTNAKLTGLGAIIVLIFCSFGAYAAESQDAAPINKDQVKGRVDEARGKVKEATGVILDDKKMQVEGNVQKNIGKVQKGYGDLKQDIKKGN